MKIHRKALHGFSVHACGLVAGKGTKGICCRETWNGVTCGRCLALKPGRNSDTMRLEWIMNSKNGRSCGRFADNGQYFVAGSNFYGKSFREVIDTAMRREKGESK